MTDVLVAGGLFAVRNLITSFASYAKKDHSKWQIDLKEKLKRLEEALSQIDAVTSYASYANKDQNKWQLVLEEELKREEALPEIDAVDSGHILMGKNRRLEEWMWQIRDAVEEAEDFMDEVEYYRLEKQIKGEKSTVSNVASLKKFIILPVAQKSTSKRLKEIVERLDEVAAHVEYFVDFLHLVKPIPSLYTDNRHSRCLLPIEHKVVERDDWKHHIINKLLNFSSASIRKNFSILPIVGFGGIGKTTLAQSIYNDQRIEIHFDERIWVRVSNNFDVLSLTKKIYKLVVDRTHVTNNLDLLQREILENLKSKRILLVLDDVWNNDDRKSWDELLAPFSSAEDGSMILLTTRMVTVAKMMKGIMEPIIFLEGMPKAEYWEFFKNCAFGDQDPKYYNKLQDIGRKIAEKLKGSPLAAKTVGGILRTNLAVEHWKNILNSEIWQLKQCENDIMPALILSYQYLSSHLKPCFRFCSIFPQDYEFNKEELIYMWMALGLLQKSTEKSRRPEDIGEEYLNELVGKSFFDCKTGLHTYYVMHNLLHELATYVSDGECFRIEKSCEFISIPKTVRHLSINTSLALPISEIAKLRYLRTLLLLEESNRSYCHIPEVLKCLKGLRILQSSQFEITHNCFSSLKHLRYLCNPHYVSSVPESVNKLYHLQFLYYGNNYAWSHDLFPPDIIGNLINLRCLTTTNSLRGNIYGLGRLTSLQILKIFKIEENVNRISELKNLRELRELGIQNLEEVTRAEEVVQANLNDKEHLQILKLSWSVYDSIGGIPKIYEEVLDALQPHFNLKKLEIKNYMGRRSPYWMYPQYLPWLVLISLDYCEQWEDLSPLGQLPRLQSLRLQYMDKVKRIGTEGDVFQSLQELYITSLPALEEFYGGATMTQWFPCLRTLCIFYCPKLRVFSNLPRGLRVLHIEHVDWTALPELWQGESYMSSSLSSLDISFCPRLKSLAKGLLLRPELFTSLEKLSIVECAHLESLGGLQALSSLKSLTVKECPKLIAAASASLSVEAGISSSLILDHLCIDNPSLLCTVPLKSISVRDLQLGDCGEGQLSELEEWVSKNRASLHVLTIERVSSRQFPLADLQSLFCLEHLEVHRCGKLQSLPKLPSSLQVLRLSDCLPELEEICLKDSGLYWSKIQHIPVIKVGDYTKKQLATITLEEHRSRTQVEQEQEEDSSSEGTEEGADYFEGMEERGDSSKETEQEEDPSGCLTTPDSWRGKFSGTERPSSLQILEKFNVEENGSNMFELKNLIELRELGIKDLQKVRECQVVFEANLEVKKHLLKLTLEWDLNHIYENGSSACPEVDEQVLDALQPHSNLESLEIKYYMGHRSPHWLAPQSLLNLVSISLDSCKGWEDLSPLGELPNLLLLQLHSVVSVKRVGSAPDSGTEVSIFPLLRVLVMKNMWALEEFHGGASTTQWLPCLERLSIIGCPNLRVFPNLPCGLKNVRIDCVSWAALPELWQGGKNSSVSMSSSVPSSSTSSLSSLEISSCGGLVSLAHGLLMHSEPFTSLEKLSISNCGELTTFPDGEFQKFTSLKELMVVGCPKLQRGSTSSKFLPPSLQSLTIQDCNALDPLPRAPEDLNFLSQLKLRGCANIISLPSAEVIGRWKALEYLCIEECSHLESLGGLQALSSLKSLTIKECPKLIAAALSSQSTLVVEDPVSSTSVELIEIGIPTESAVEVAQGPVEATSSSSPSCSSSALILDDLVIDNPLVLCTVPLKTISAREVKIEFCDDEQSLALAKWVLKNQTSMQMLHFTNVSSPQLPLVDLQTFTCLKYLLVLKCSSLRSLPKLPSNLKILRLYDCPPELEESCLKDSGPHWPKIQHIPDVTIGNYSKEELATITSAEHKKKKQKI